ncbi:transposase [Streptomyces sp. NPDC003032]
MEPLLPPSHERPQGPRPVDDRQCLQGILYVLHNDVARQLLPLDPGFGFGQTCWRRLTGGIGPRLPRNCTAS